MTKNKTRRLRCRNCKKLGKDVKSRANAFAREIRGVEKAMHTVCDDCDYNNRMDI